MWDWHLQWFAGEKTEKPTEKKRQEARKKGQVARSQEVNTALAIIFCFLALSILGPQTFDGMERIMSHVLGLTTQENLSPVVVLKTGGDIALRSFFLMAPYLLVALAAGLLANFLQVGFLFSALKVNWGRLNPLSGIKRVFGKHALAELVKCLLKVSIVGCAAYSIVAKNMVVFPKLMEMNIQTAVAAIGQIGFEVGWRVGLLLVIVAAFDVWYQRYTHEESLKMSKQEVKDERKQMEGNPEIKAKVRQKMRQMAMRRMMQ
ncbi:MAG: EscU/YscU/HrcU family type III secretion system export apparatus switch protein, partial [Heliobacteriaceae bacterium]|nr:EscU/YscU/HrcU family type III secretion system export apparatus switch protein [Heliobacteriaceae bacterium]